MNIIPVGQRPHRRISDGSSSRVRPRLGWTVQLSTSSLQLALVITLLTPSAPVTAATRVLGDCNSNGEVTIDELLTMVNITLGNLPVSKCTAGDADGDGTIAVSEIILAVNSALGTPQPAAADTPTPARTATVTATERPTEAPPTLTPTEPAFHAPSATPTQLATPLPTMPIPPTDTATPTRTATPSPTLTPTVTLLPTVTPTLTGTPTATLVPSSTRTPSKTLTSSRTPTVTATPSATPTLPPPPDVLLMSPVFPVNTSTGAQGKPAVCRSNGGDFVVVWAAQEGILGRRYASDGTAQGGEFAIDTEGSAPAVSCDAVGDFVVAWTATNNGALDVFARQYASSGQPMAARFLVNTYTTGDQTTPDVCSDATGNFVVVWASDGQDGSSSGVFGRLFGSNGSSRSSELQLNTTTAGFQGQPAVTCNASGSFVVVWSANQIGGSITGRRFDHNGAAQSAEFSTTAIPGSTALLPDVAGDPDGAFVVVWQSDYPVAGVDNPHVVFAQHFPGGSTFDVGFTKGNALTSPAVTVDPGGGFVVVWQNTGIPICTGDRLCSTSTDCRDPALPTCYFGTCCDTSPTESGTQIIAQRFTSGDAPREGQLHVAPGTLPAIASDVKGDFVVAYAGVFARRFSEVMPPAVQALTPCHGAGDLWSFNVQAGQDITVQVDTVDQTTASDLCFSVDCGAFSFGGDDDLPCSFPPSDFSCPRASIVAPATSTCALTVNTCSLVCGDPNRANYALTVDLDGNLVPLMFSGAGQPATPTGPVKITPTPSPTPTRPPSEKRSLDIRVYRSLNDKAYIVLLPVSDRRVQITSLAIANGPVRFFAEQFAPGAAQADLVLTALAGTQGGSVLPPSTIQRTDVLTNVVPSVTFDGCANSGEGLLTFASGQQVSTLGLSPNQPSAAATVPLTQATTDIPEAVVKTVRRNFANELVTAQTVVFPNPPAQCVGGPNAGLACVQDVCVGGSCGQTSNPPTCSLDDSVICDPAQSNSCILNGVCNHFGGEAGGQDITLDDTLDRPVGNPASQISGADGFLLDGHCGDPATCQAIVFVLDAAATDSLSVSAAGFLVDDTGNVIGTAAGEGENQPQTCTLPEEFRVNSTDDAAGPAICNDPAGNAVIVWSGIGQNGTYEVFGQRYAGDGTAIGTQFQVNTFTTGTQGGAAVCCAADGGFVVTWTSDGQDGDDYGVFARRYASNGAPLDATEFQANTFTMGPQLDPTIACLNDGGFVIAWTSGQMELFVEGQDGSASGVFGQVYANNGTRVGNEFELNTLTKDVQAFPHVCASGDGFVAVWTHRDFVSARFRTAIRRYATLDTSTGGESIVTTSTDSELQPSVACAVNGDVTAAWKALTFATAGPGGEVGGVFAEVFPATPVVPQPTPFPVSDVPNVPAIAPDANGTFVVVWPGVVGQRLAGDGSKLGMPFQANATSDASTAAPELTCDNTGLCTVVWSASGETGATVFAQRLHP